MGSELLSDLSDDEYEQIEDALLSSIRGRAFLRMRDRRHRIVAVDDVRRLIRDNRDPTSIDPGLHIRILRRELQELSAHIAQTRREIASLKPDDPAANRIMLATEELDAILQATEHATTEILSGSERIQSVADRLRKDRPEMAALLDQEVTDIMTACSFQDITGQRMTKVVNTLRYIERRVHAMIQIWGGLEAEERGAAPIDDTPTRSDPDGHLIHGPALRGGINQDAVDALLAGAAAASRSNDDPLATRSPAPLPPSPKNDAGAAGAPEMSQSAVDTIFT